MDQKFILAGLFSLFFASFLWFWNPLDPSIYALKNKVNVDQFSAGPHLTLWRVDSMHLSDETKGNAEFWPCDIEYYFNYQPNVEEDIIIEIKNDGDATLT